MDKLRRVKNLKKILVRLHQLKLEKLIPKAMNYDFIFSVVELVENELDEVKYIDLVENSKQPHLIVRALLILKKENLLAQKYIEFISDIDPIQPYPVVKAIILESLKKNNLLSNKHFESCKNHSNLLSLENIITILLEKPGYLLKYFPHLIHKNASIIQRYIHFLKIIIY